MHILNKITFNIYKLNNLRKIPNLLSKSKQGRKFGSQISTEGGNWIFSLLSVCMKMIEVFPPNLRLSNMDLKLLRATTYSSHIFICQSGS